MCGAQERTRTFTAVKPLAPEASASTNSATWAQVAGLERRLLRTGRAVVKSLRRRPNAYYRGMIFSETGPTFPDHALYSARPLAYRETAKSPAPDAFERFRNALHALEYRHPRHGF